MVAPFSNEPLPVEELPRLRDAAFVSVDPRYIWGRLAGLAMSAGIVVTVAALVMWQSEPAAVPAIIAGGVVVLIVSAAILSVLEARRVAYQVREHDLSLRRGVIRHVVETIPYSRVQHVNVGRGLIERWLGLATLEISSAGPDISVPGLAVADADRIKQVIAQRAGVDDESEGPDPVAMSTSWPPPPLATSPSPPAPGS
jgi:membrane protein YdbS with pleckstrin-like domain